MDINDFKEELIKYKIKLPEDQIQKLYNFMKMTLDWNEKVNLTAITDEYEFILKHIIDCLSVKFKNVSNVIDVGTGGGFPGMILAIVNPNIQFTLMDSLGKRIHILEEEVEKLKLKNVKLIHSRVEDLGKNEEYREQYDIAISRAVASLNILLEYLTPFVKVGGRIIAMKGENYQEELKLANNAINEFKLNSFNLENTILNHINLTFTKISKTPLKYPRNPGQIKKQPL